jgi:hypothetical protein
MIAVFLSALFLASGLLATATIVASWRRHAPAVRAIQAELAACEPWRQVRVRTYEITVVSSATILSLKPAGRNAPTLPPYAPGLPAAA